MTGLGFFLGFVYLILIFIIPRIFVMLYRLDTRSDFLEHYSEILEELTSLFVEIYLFKKGILIWELQSGDL